jgi:hypothetical protein
VTLSKSTLPDGSEILERRTNQGGGAKVIDLLSKLIGNFPIWFPEQCFDAIVDDVENVC